MLTFDKAGTTTFRSRLDASEGTGAGLRIGIGGDNKEEG